MIMRHLQSCSGLLVRAAILAALLAVAVAPPKKTTENDKTTAPISPPKDKTTDPAGMTDPKGEGQPEQTTNGVMSFGKLDGKPEVPPAEKELPEKPLPVKPSSSIVNLGNAILGGINDVTVGTIKTLKDGASLVAKLPLLILEQLGPKENVESFVNKYKVPDKEINLHEMAPKIITEHSRLIVKDITIKNFKMSQVLPAPKIGPKKAFSLKIPDMDIEISVNMDLKLSLFTEKSLEIPLDGHLTSNMGQPMPEMVIPNYKDPGKEPSPTTFARIEWPFQTNSPKGYYWMKMGKMHMNLAAEFALVPAVDAITAHEKYTIVVEEAKQPEAPKKSKTEQIKDFFKIKKTSTLENPEVAKSSTDGPPKLELDPSVEAKMASKLLAESGKEIAKAPAAKISTLKKKPGANHDGHIHDPAKGYTVVLIPTSECAGLAEEFDMLLKDLGMWGIPEWAAKKQWAKDLVHKKAINYVLQNTVCNTIAGLLNSVLIGFQEKAPGLQFLLKKSFGLKEDDAKHLDELIDEQNKVDTKAVKAETAKANTFVMPEEVPVAGSGGKSTGDKSKKPEAEKGPAKEVPAKKN